MQRLRTQEQEARRRAGHGEAELFAELCHPLGNFDMAIIPAKMRFPYAIVSLIAEYYTPEWAYKRENNLVVSAPDNDDASSMACLMDMSRVPRTWPLSQIEKFVEYTNVVCVHDRSLMNRYNLRVSGMTWRIAFSFLTVEAPRFGLAQVEENRYDHHQMFELAANYELWIRVKAWCLYNPTVKAALVAQYEDQLFTRNNYVAIPQPEIVVRSPGDKRVCEAFIGENVFMARRTAHQISRCQSLVVALKAYFALNFICSIDTVDALATSSRHLDAWGAVINAAWNSVLSIWAVMAGLFRATLEVADEFQKAPPTVSSVLFEEFVILSLVFACSYYGYYTCKCLCAAYHGRHLKQLNITNTVEKSETKFVAKEITAEGTFYRFVVNGKLYVLPELTDSSSVTKAEMCLPGSEMFPSVLRNVGAVLVATEKTEAAVLGCFWRYGDWLITASHVANAASAGVANVYLASPEKGTRDIYRLRKNVFPVAADFFNLEGSEVKREIDVFVRKLSKSDWATIGVATSAICSSAYKQTVNAVGFVDKMLVTSSGFTLEGSGNTELWHSASTNKGFSGAPLLRGNKVVGMHVGAKNGDKNQAVRVEAILHELFTPESDPSTIGSEYEEDLKYHGHKATFEQIGDDDFVIEGRGGKVAYGKSRADIERLFPTKRTQTQFEEEEDREEGRSVFHNLLRDASKPKRWADYEDESAPVAPGVRFVAREKPVHCNKTPPEQPFVTDWLDKQADELKSLGYDADKYAYPAIDASVEETSVLNHLKLFHDRVMSITKPPTVQEMNRVVHVVLQKLDHNKYEPTPRYKDPAHIIAIIDSSAVKENKSPGHPYQGDGLVRNADVIAKHTKQGLAEITLRKWREDIRLKPFCKAEPNKRHKLEKGMARIVAAMPLHTMIKNQAVFSELLVKAVENWEHSPIKYAFNPALPGHISHLADCFKNRGVYESDKPNWDFMFHDFVFSMCTEITKQLAVRVDGWTDDAWDEYLKDIDFCAEEVCDAAYQCTNGKVYKSSHRGIMKSGWLMTIFFNSLGQLVVDTLVQLRCGATDEEILSPDRTIIAGGDDVLQTFPNGYDLERYKTEAAALGFQLDDFKIHKEFDGCEFFSSVFKRRDGAWTFIPQRFTKHIAALRTTKLEDLAGAIASHQMNWAWDNKKFEFFSKMFRGMRALQPENFGLQYVKSQRQLQYKMLGVDVRC
jgi:hypothetical protein